MNIWEKIKKTSLLMIIFSLVFFVLLFVITWNNYIGYKLEFSNHSKKTDLYVHFWDGVNKHSAFGENDSLLVKKSGTNPKETIPFKNGSYLQFQTEPMLKDSLPITYSFEFKTHFISNDYEVFLMNKRMNNEDYFYFIYRFNIDSKIKFSWINIKKHIAYVIEVIKNLGRRPLHVEGHACDPDPTQPPGYCKD